MNIYGFCYDGNNNFTVYSVKAKNINQFTGTINTIDGDTIDIHFINLYKTFDCYTLDNEMFFFLDKKLAYRIYNHFKKKVLQSIDNEISYYNDFKTKIQNCKFITEI